MQIVMTIPCYNEGNRLDSPKFIDFCRQNPNIRFLMVNDGSQDHTLSILDQMSKECSRIEVLDIKHNSGKANAVYAGIHHTLTSKQEVDYLGYWDADLATPLDEILKFQRIALERQRCFLLGARWLCLGRKIIRKSYRHYMGRVFATVVSLMLGLPVYDSQCGAKLFDQETARILFSTKFTSPWFFDVELLFRFKSNQLKVWCEEVPVSEWQDIDGSKLSLLDFIKTPIELFRIYKRYS